MGVPIIISNRVRTQITRGIAAQNIITQKEPSPSQGVTDEYLVRIVGIFGKFQRDGSVFLFVHAFCVAQPKRRTFTDAACGKLSLQDNTITTIKKWKAATSHCFNMRRTIRGNNMGNCRCNFLFIFYIKHQN